MAASVDQPDTTSNVTNAGSFPNQPIPPGHGSTSDSANPTTIGNTTAKPLPGTPRTGGRVTDMSPTVASRPNPASASNTNRGQVQKAPSRPMSPLERSSTGLEMIGYDPIRGDIPQHQMFMLDVDVDEDVRGVPKRPGGRNGVGRLSAYRPRSMMSRGEGTMAGPGSRRGSRMMIDAPDVIPVSILFFLPIDEIRKFNRPFCRQRRRFKTGYSPLSMLQQRKETSIGDKVRLCNPYWAA